MTHNEVKTVSLACKTDTNSLSISILSHETGKAFSNGNTKVRREMCCLSCAVERNEQTIHFMHLSMTRKVT